jgi:hypothetical protein
MAGLGGVSAGVLTAASACFEAVARGFPTDHLRDPSGVVEFDCEVRQSGFHYPHWASVLSQVRFRTRALDKTRICSLQDADLGPVLLRGWHSSQFADVCASPCADFSPGSVPDGGSETRAHFDTTSGADGCPAPVPDGGPETRAHFGTVSIADVYPGPIPDPCADRGTTPCADVPPSSRADKHALASAHPRAAPRADGRSDRRQLYRWDARRNGNGRRLRWP